jgi:hypothetical protein
MAVDQMFDRCEETMRHTSRPTLHCVSGPSFNLARLSSILEEIYCVRLRHVLHGSSLAEQTSWSQLDEAAS